MLLNCVAYQNGVKLADLAVEEISDYLERKDCFVWVGLRDTTEAELETMQKEFGLHDLAVEDARHGHQRPGRGSRRPIHRQASGWKSGGRLADRRHRLCPRVSQPVAANG